ncbi:MAG: hypothetical protein GXO19_06795 [Epsilonproteobacteria bacterium]|nr:hypothetical protein [Campylobacterota bacterium]NPA57423.1 hypothetical protein [Campylobacterota bacterium]
MIYPFLLLYGGVLLYGAATLGIGPGEAVILFHNPFYHLLYQLFPGSELLVRLPTILVTLLNIYLFYRLALRELRRRDDAFLAAVLFALLPAVIGSAVVINKAPFIIFLTLLFLLLYTTSPPLSYPLALLMLFLDNSFATLFLGVALYNLSRRREEALFFAGLFIASIALFGFDVGGKPRNYFLDTFATFAAIFSPLLFLYFFYTIYRIWVKERKDLIWFISATAFLFSLALSFRQRISLIDFAPFAVIGVILMVRTYNHSLRVRLRRYKGRLRFYFSVVIVTLLLNDLLLLFNSLLFDLFPSKTKYIYPYYEGRILAQLLKERGVDCLQVGGKLQWQLRFYGIGECREYILSQSGQGGAIPLFLYYRGRHLATFYVLKGNRKGEEKSVTNRNFKGKLED